MPSRNRWGDPLPPPVDVAAEKAKIRRIVGLICPACDRNVRDGHADDCTGQEAADA